MSNSVGKIRDLKTPSLLLTPVILSRILFRGYTITSYTIPPMQKDASLTYLTYSIPVVFLDTGFICALRTLFSTSSLETLVESLLN